MGLDPRLASITRSHRTSSAIIKQTVCLRCWCLVVLESWRRGAIPLPNCAWRNSVSWAWRRPPSAPTSNAPKVSNIRKRRTAAPRYADDLPRAAGLSFSFALSQSRSNQHLKLGFPEHAALSPPSCSTSVEQVQAADANHHGWARRIQAPPDPRTRAIRRGGCEGARRSARTKVGQRPSDKKPKRVLVMRRERPVLPPDRSQPSALQEHSHGDLASRGRPVSQHCCDT